jgi:hypothetical protein
LKTKLEQAIAFINAGDEKRGRELLIEILKSDPANDTAWIWMAAVTNEYQLRKDCLEEALKHNPGNKTAKRALMKLQEQERIPSTTVADKKHPRKRHPLIALLHIFSVVFIFLGLLLAFVNWGHHQSDLSFQSEGQVIQADIVRLYSVIGRGTGDYAEYAYKVDGRRYTDEFMIPHQDWMKMEVGDPILIRYLPSQPESTRYYSYEKDIDPEEEYRQGWIFAGVFLILPMVVEGALAVARESTRKRRNAK